MRGLRAGGKPVRIVVSPANHAKGTNVMKQWKRHQELEYGHELIYLDGEQKLLISLDGDKNEAELFNKAAYDRGSDPVFGGTLEECQQEGEKGDFSPESVICICYSQRGTSGMLKGTTEEEGYHSPPLEITNQVIGYWYPGDDLDDGPRQCGTISIPKAFQKAVQEGYGAPYNWEYKTVNQYVFLHKCQGRKLALTDC